MTRHATDFERADHFRDLAKHDLRASDPPPLDQRLSVAQLVGYCEGLANSGLLNEDAEFNLRKNIADVLVAFNMPSKFEREPA